MAQKVTVETIDDLDGGRADETVGFKLDGKDYEIDLSRANAAKLRDAMACYVAVARRGGNGQAPQSMRRRPQAAARSATRTVAAPVQEPAPVAEPEPEPEPEPVRIAQTTVKPRTSDPVAPVQADDTARIRKWAQARGMKVGDRGRISPDVKKAYYEENGEVGDGAAAHAAAASTFKSAPTVEYEDRTEHNRVIREWALANGYPCPPRGTIPEATRLAHDREKGKPVYRNPTAPKPKSKPKPAARARSTQVEIAGAIKARDLDPAVAKAVRKAVQGGAVFSDV